MATDARSYASELKYTFVTVVHEEDFELLRLQARSLERYLDPNICQEILVIDNSSSRALWKGSVNLVREYGSRSSQFRILDKTEVASVPSWVGGWHSQQILKLMVSRKHVQIS